MDAEDLLALTHMDSPWQKNYRPMIDRNPIPDADLRGFFSGQAVLENPIHARFHDLFAERKFGAMPVSIDVQLPTGVQIAQWEFSLGIC